MITLDFDTTLDDTAIECLENGLIHFENCFGEHLGSRDHVVYIRVKDAGHQGDAMAHSTKHGIVLAPKALEQHGPMYGSSEVTCGVFIHELCHHIGAGLSPYEADTGSSIDVHLQRPWLWCVSLMENHLADDDLEFKWTVDILESMLGESYTEDQLTHYKPFHGFMGMT